MISKSNVSAAALEEFFVTKYCYGRGVIAGVNVSNYERSVIFLGVKNKQLLSPTVFSFYSFYFDDDYSKLSAAFGKDYYSGIGLAAYLRDLLKTRVLRLSTLFMKYCWFATK